MLRRSYEKLVVWQRSVALVEAVHRLVQKLPASEKAALGVAMTRAALTPAGKVADAAGRTSPREVSAALDAALAALRELVTYLCVGERLGAISRWQSTRLRWRIGRLERLLERTVAELQESEPPAPQLKAAA